MTDTKQDPLPPQEFQRHWRIVTIAGMLGASYFTLCVQGMARVAFLKELGATAWHFGIIAGMGAFALSFQIVGGWLSNRLTSRKKVWTPIVILHRVLFLGVLAAPFLFADTTWCLLWIITVLFVHDAITHVSVPLWLAWMADIVPEGSFNRLWGSRQRGTTIARIAAELVLIFVFGWFERRDMVIPGFIILGVGGVIVGVIDILLFKDVPEPEPDLERDTPGLRTVLQPLLDPEFRPFLKFNATFHCGVALFAPFFPIYLMSEMQIEAYVLQILILAGTITIVPFSRFWGILSDTYGKRPVLRMVMTGKIVVPIAMILALPNPQWTYPLLIIAFAIDGAMNAGLMLVLQAYMMQTTPRRNRAMYIAVTSFFAMGIAMTVVPPIAGKFIDFFADYKVHLGPYALGSYQFVFFISVLCRLRALAMVERLNDKRSLPTRVMLANLRDVKPFRTTRAIALLTEATTPKKRERAAQKLGKLQSPLAIGELIRALRDPDRTVRHAAADALGQIGAGEASAELAVVLNDPESGIQAPAARALGQIGDKQSLSALLANLEEADAQLLREKIAAIQNIGDTSAMLPLICLFNQVEDEELKRHIASALSAISGIGAPEAVDKLLRPPQRPIIP